MGRKIVADRTIFDEINKGNRDVAKRLKDLVAAGAEIWITKYDEDQLTPADETLMTELHIRSPLQDNYVDRYHSRGMLDNFRDHAGTVKTGWRRPATTAALAFHLKAELMTMDKEFEQSFLKFGVVPGMRALSSATGSVDYGRARQLFGLAPLRIDSAGKILPKLKPGPGAPAKVPGAGGAVRYEVNNRPDVSYPPGRPIDSEYKWKNKVGDPIKAPNEYGPSPKGQAGFQAAATIGLQGLSWVIQEINDRIEKKRFDEAWAKLKPTIDAKLNEDPTMGVLILVNYSQKKKKGAEPDSPLEHPTVFQKIKYSFGYTKEDARMRMSSAPPDMRPVAGPDEDVQTSEMWFPPKQPVDVTKLPTPFEKAGLATFVPGREKLVKVKFSGRWGFDDKMFSVEKLDLPTGMVPQFFYLWPPDRIAYRDDDGVLRSSDVETSLEHAAWAMGAELAFSLVPVVCLDSWINPYNATAAIVYPANNATANLFKTTAPTQDNLGYLKSYRMELVRWIKTENMYLLQDFTNAFDSP